MTRSPTYHILRVGMAVTFLWISILIFREPAAWGGLLLPWAAGLLPVPLMQAMIGTAILDLLIGFFLLIDVGTWVAAALGAVHLVIVLATTGITSITVRDIGLLTGTLALFWDGLPDGLKRKFKIGKKA